MRLFLIVFACFVFISCSDDPRQILDPYRGGIVYGKSEIYYPSFNIRMKNEVRQIFVYRLDYDKYNIGDTIK